MMQQSSKYLVLSLCLILLSYFNQLAAKERSPTIVITGATEEPIEGFIWIFCGKSEGLIDGKNFQELDISMSKKLVQFNIVLPLNTSIGKRKIIASHDYPPNRSTEVKVRFRDSKVVSYQKNGVGEIDIKQMPKAEGEMFVADITAKLSSKKKGDVSITVKINAKAGTQSFDECPSA